MGGLWIGYKSRLEGTPMAKSEITAGINTVTIMDYNSNKLGISESSPMIDKKVAEEGRSSLQQNAN